MKERGKAVRYEAVTAGVRVRAEPAYAEEESAPEEGQYFWTYTIEIHNGGREAVQLKSRLWRITDANGRTQEVRGPGVVGQTPMLRPGQSFSYTSGCPLETPSGIMSGCYQMQAADGRMFNVEIPPFPLESPYVKRRLN